MDSFRLRNNCVVGGLLEKLGVWSASPLLIEGTLTGPPNCAFGFCAFI